MLFVGLSVLNSPLRFGCAAYGGRRYAFPPYGPLAHYDAVGLGGVHFIALRPLPQDDVAYGKRLGMIKSHVSRRCEHLLIPVETRSASRIKRRQNDFWQRRFWEHQIRDDRDFERCVDYIHYNPVNHRLAQRAKEWPYSTFHRYVSRGAHPTLAENSPTQETCFLVEQVTHLECERHERYVQY